MKEEPAAVPIEEFLTALSGKDRKAVIASGSHCTTCDTPDMNFREDIDRNEYQISGMCQACQDDVFNDEEE